MKAQENTGNFNTSEDDNRRKEYLTRCHYEKEHYLETGHSDLGHYPDRYWHYAGGYFVLVGIRRRRCLNTYFCTLNKGQGYVFFAWLCLQIKLCNSFLLKHKEIDLTNTEMWLTLLFGFKISIFEPLETTPFVFETQYMQL